MVSGISLSPTKKKLTGYLLSLQADENAQTEVTDNVFVLSCIDDVAKSYNQFKK